MNDFAIPDHVPPAMVFAFDMFAPEGVSEDPQLAWLRLRAVAPEIFWTPHNGGHWVATRGDDIKVMQLDHEHFSHRELAIPVMKNPPLRALPITLDPPENAPYRRLIMPAFVPRAIQSLEAKARALAISLIEEIKPKGECEFVGEFASVLPLVVFLGMVDLPAEDRNLLRPWAEANVRASNAAAREDAHRNMMGYLARWIDERQTKPGDDLLSTIIHSQIDGRPITGAEILGISVVLMLGGLDTVASMLGFAAHFLATHPQHRRQLIAEPRLIPNAIEEIIRRHGLTNTARYISQDCRYKNIDFKEGDLIVLPNALYGLDEGLVDDPLKVDFHRPYPILHAAFGNGTHTCPGAVLARREIKVFLEEWLSRIPEFEIKPGTKPEFATGVVNSVNQIYLSWR